MDDTYTPVVKAKPERGREIKSAKMQTEKLIESLKNVSGQPDSSSERQDEVYHEGYVDGQKYLVPDSNLEAMKDIINIKMRPRRSLRYKHETSFEISDYNHFQDKLKGLLDKMNQLGDASPESSKEPSVASSVSAETNESRGTRTDSKEDAELKRSEASSKESKASKESSVATLKSHISKSMEEEIEPNLTENTEDNEEKERKLESNKSENQENDIASFKNGEQSETSPVVVFGREKECLKISNDEETFSEEKSPVTTKESSRLSDGEKKPLQLQKTVRFSEEENKPMKLQQTLGLMNDKDKITIPQFQEASQCSDYKEEPVKYQGPLQFFDEGKETTSIKEPLKLTEASEYSIKETLSTKTHDKVKGSSTFLDQMEPSPIKPPLIKPQVFESIEPKEYRVRFLISGHLRDDRPIFIIQENNSKSFIFKNQKADFIETKRNGNIDLAISGKFYKHNILEELNGEPILYNILPDKIIINKEKTRVYINNFSDVFHCEKVVLTAKGEFIRHEITNLLTPLLSFSVEPKVPEFSTSNKDYNPYSNDTPTMVLIYSPRCVNPFAHNDNNNTNNNRASAVVLACESNYSNLYSCAGENNIRSRDAMGPISLNMTGSPYSFPSVLKYNINKDNLQTTNHSSSYVDPIEVIGYKPNHRELYSRKQWERKKHQYFPRRYESLSARETTLENPKLRSYYYNDEKGEYYSTYKDDELEYAKHDDLKQLDSSNKIATKNKLNHRKNTLEKDSTIKEHENPSDKDKHKSKNVTMERDENLICPLHEVNEGSHLLLEEESSSPAECKDFPSACKSLNAREIILQVPELKSYYLPDDKCEYYSTYRDGITDYEKTD